MCGLFPLTPSLSLRERGNQGQSLDISWHDSLAEGLAPILHLPKGDGRGEGEQTMLPPGGAIPAIAYPVSDFGLRISFGFRPSGFGFHPLPP
jgi:hypothetical protein